MYFHPRFLYARVSSTEDLHSSEKDGSISPSSSQWDHEAAANSTVSWLTRAFAYFVAASVIVFAAALAGFSAHGYYASHVLYSNSLYQPSTHPIAASQRFSPSSHDTAPAAAAKVQSTIPSTLALSSTPSPSEPHRPGPEPIYSCGNSSTEALANDCVWNQLAIAWQPRACSAAYTEDFLAYGIGVGQHDMHHDPPYSYFADSAGTQELSTHDLARKADSNDDADAGPGDGAAWYWMSRRTHKAHCAYMMLRFYDAVEKGERIDSIAASKRHAKSCLEDMLQAMSEGEGWEEVNTVSKVRFLSC